MSISITFLMNTAALVVIIIHCAAAVDSNGPSSRVRVDVAVCFSASDYAGCRCGRSTRGSDFASDLFCSALLQHEAHKIDIRAVRRERDGHAAAESLAVFVYRRAGANEVARQRSFAVGEQDTHRVSGIS